MRGNNSFVPAMNLTQSLVMSSDFTVLVVCLFSCHLLGKNKNTVCPFMLALTILLLNGLSQKRKKSNTVQFC